jgi:hypothetical protein
MSERVASCSCGPLHVTCIGEPVRISICHCIACQRRTGSVFGAQARFHRDQLTNFQGRASHYTRSADSGNSLTFSFCPNCGATVYWQLSGFPDLYAVAIGAFADPAFPEPRHSVYERSRHAWALAPGNLPLEHLE